MEATASLQPTWSPALGQLFWHPRADAHQLPCFPEEKLQYRYLNPQTEKGAEPNPALTYPRFRCVTASDTTHYRAIPTPALDTRPLAHQLPWVLMKEHLSPPYEPCSAHEFTPKLQALQLSSSAHQCPPVRQAKIFDSHHTYVGGEQIKHQCVNRCLRCELALRTGKTLKN